MEWIAVRPEPLVGDRRSGIPISARGLAEQPQTAEVMDSLRSVPVAAQQKRPLAPPSHCRPVARTASSLAATVGALGRIRGRRRRDALGEPHESNIANSPIMPRLEISGRSPELASR